MKTLLLVTLFSLGACSSFKLPVQEHIVKLAVPKDVSHIGTITEKRMRCVKDLFVAGVSQKRIVEMCDSIYGSVDQ